MNSPNIILVRELSIIDTTSRLFNNPVLHELEYNGLVINHRFTFVGVYYSASHDITIIGYPKYYPEQIKPYDIPAVIQHVSIICQVVERAQPFLDKSLFESSYMFNAHNVNEHRQYVNRYNLAMSILQDYMSNGIYFSKTTQRMHNGKGPIQWQHTIHRTTPIVDRDVIYLDTLHSQITQDFSQLASHLHIWIVLQCARLMQGIGQYQGLVLPKANVYFNSVDLSQFIPYLLGRLTFAYSDREVRLLKALSSWCGQSPFYLSQLGVTAFEKIWEYATKEVFGNISDTRSGPPSYYFKGREYKAQGDFIPDILRVINNVKNGYDVIGILDAKYYCPEYDVSTYTVYGAPANADIAKQIGYYHYMKQLYPQDHIKFTNAFLFPVRYEYQELLFEHTGYAYPNSERSVEIDGLLNITNRMPPQRQDRVLVFNVNPHALFSACLNGTKIDDVSFYDRFVVPFEE